MHAVATTPAGRLGDVARLPQPRRPSLLCCQVGSCIVLFEACSAFTARYGLHARQVAICDPYAEGFNGFVTSTVASAATGWNDSYQVGISPTEDTRLSTAHSKVATRFGLKVAVFSPRPKQVAAMCRNDSDAG